MNTKQINDDFIDLVMKSGNEIEHAAQAASRLVISKIREYEEKKRLGLTARQLLGVPDDK